AIQRGAVPDAGPGFAGATRAPAPAVASATDVPAASTPAAAPTTSVGLFDDLDGFLADDPDEATVVRLERELLSDRVRADPATVAAILHPEWEEIGASGRRWSRDELLAEIAPLPSPVELELLATHRVTDDA